MRFHDFLFRVVLSNVLTVFYSSVVVLLIGVSNVKCLFQFKNPFKKTLRLLPPPPLFDTKYGVHKYVMVNRGLKLHYVESGDQSKKMMLFVHGFPEFWYSWRHQILEFQKDYWCVAIDMRGYGDSEKPESVYDYKMELMVEDIRDLIEKLGAKKVVMVSHDWGALVASTFRESHPELLHGLIMLGGCSRLAWFTKIWEDWSQMFKSWYVFMFRMPWVAEQMILSNDLQMYNKSMLVPGNVNTTEEDIECYKYWFGKPFALTGPLNYYRANFSYSAPPFSFHNEKVPLLVALGDRDPYLNPNLLDVMKTQYAVVETKIIENAGHFCQQLLPEKINKIIRDFLIKNNL